MTIDEFLDWLLYLARKALGAFGTIGVPTLVLWLAWWLLKKLLLGLWPAMVVANANFIALLLLFVLLALLLLLLNWLGKLPPLVTPGCALTRHRFWRDRCTTTTCTKTCIALTGPYPAWMGKFAILQQHVGCICPNSPYAPLAPFLQKVLDQAIGIADLAELQRAIEALIPTAGDDPRLAELLRILEKLKNGRPLTDEEREKFKQVVEGR